MLLWHCCRCGQQCWTSFLWNFSLSTKWKQIEHVQFVSTLSKWRNFVWHGCPKRQRQYCRSNIRLCRKNHSTCSIRQCCFDVVDGVDGALVSWLVVHSANSVATSAVVTLPAPVWIHWQYIAVAAQVAACLLVCLLQCQEHANSIIMLQIWVFSDYWVLQMLLYTLSKQINAFDVYLCVKI